MTRSTYLFPWQTRRGDRIGNPWRSYTRDPYGALYKDTLAWKRETPGGCEEPLGISSLLPSNKQLKQIWGISIFLKGCEVLLSFTTTQTWSLFYMHAIEVTLFTAGLQCTNKAFILFAVYASAYKSVPGWSTQFLEIKLDPEVPRSEVFMRKWITRN